MAKKTAKEFSEFVERQRQAIGLGDLKKRKFSLPDKWDVGKDPYIEIDPPVAGSYTNKMTGQKVKQYHSRRSVLTVTSKMACASFSLPAGPPPRAGTCPASTIKPDPARGIFICHGCYGLGGNYRFKNVQFAQAVRRLWVMQGLNDGTFVDGMVRVIEKFTSRQKTARLPWGGKAQLDHSFFRIHDVGDFWTPKYFEAWVKVCEALPKITFWSPTRMWTSADMLNLMHETKPKNLTIRPSALYLNEGPEVYSFLDDYVDSVSIVNDAPVRGAWDCPAYREATHTCADSQGPNKKKPCRACWKLTSTKINYAPHGTLEKKKGKKVGKNIADLLAVVSQYDEEVKKNPDTPFETFLVSKGYRADDFTEDQWVTILADKGMDEMEISSFLERIGEWGDQQ